MKYIVGGQVVLSRAPDGPLAVHLGPFVQSQSAGYARESIRCQVRLAAGFSHWLQQQGIALRYVCSDHLPQYVRDRARRMRPCSSDAATLRHLLDFLRCEGVIAAEKPVARRLTSAEHHAHAYGQYLRDARALIQRRNSTPGSRLNEAFNKPLRYFLATPVPARAGRRRNFARLGRTIRHVDAQAL